MQRKDANSYKELFNFLLWVHPPLFLFHLIYSSIIRKTAVDNGWQFKMVEEGGMFLTDFEWAPHLAKNHVLSETSMIPGSKVVDSSGCNFHFASGIMKDSKQFSWRLHNHYILYYNFALQLAIVTQLSYHVFRQRETSYEVVVRQVWRAPGWCQDADDVGLCSWPGYSGKRKEPFCCNL